MPSTATVDCFDNIPTMEMEKAITDVGIGSTFIMTFIVLCSRYDCNNIIFARQMTFEIMLLIDKFFSRSILCFAYCLFKCCIKTFLFLGDARMQPHWYMTPVSFCDKKNIY